MLGNHDLSSMTIWLMDVREEVKSRAPHILDFLHTYEEEAIFGRQFIAKDLTQLNKGASILEVGGGSLLLSCQLAREGFNVVALEPSGQGFSHFDLLREIVLERANALGCGVPEVLNYYGEELAKINCFDYAFSINVMEHVNDVAMVIANVGMSLRSGAHYHFTCPNYLFPYECHFNIPTLFSKKLTETVMRKSIYERSHLADPVGVWRSLNWITVPQLKKIVAKQAALKVEFNRHFLVATLARINENETFASRRSVWVRRFITMIVKLNVHRLASCLPVAIHPVIDCKLRKIY